MESRAEIVINCTEHKSLNLAGKLPSGSGSLNDFLDGLEDFLNENWKARKILFDDGEMSETQKFLDITRHDVRATNYVGTIIFRGVQINVYPKVFADADATPELLTYNIAKWLEYGDSRRFRYIDNYGDYEAPRSLLELYICLYANLADKALEKSAFFQYEDVTEDRQSARGRIDFNDYASRKCVSGRADTFSCTYSSFEYDNTLNRIIKCVSANILKRTKNRYSRKILRKVVAKLSEVSDVPCTAKDCDRVRLNRFSEGYEVILNLSRMFLKGNSVSYDKSRYDAFCFLFPMEMLFEGFVGGFIRKMYGSGHVFLQKAGSENLLFDSVRVSDSRLDIKGVIHMRNDIYVRFDDERRYVLDTKYKTVHSTKNMSDVDIRKFIDEDTRDGDIYQVLAYARKRGLGDVYLIYPMQAGEEPYFRDVFGVNRVADGGIPVNVHFIKVPFVFTLSGNGVWDTEKEFDVIARKIFDSSTYRADSTRV